MLLKNVNYPSLRRRYPDVLVLDAQSMGHKEGIQITPVSPKRERYFLSCVSETKNVIKECQLSESPQELSECTRLGCPKYGTQRRNTNYPSFTQKRKIFF